MTKAALHEALSGRMGRSMRGRDRAAARRAGLRVVAWGYSVGRIETVKRPAVWPERVRIHTRTIVVRGACARVWIATVPCSR